LQLKKYFLPMQNALFLQSDVADPYTLYDTMLATNPVWFDEANNILAVYNYDDCKAILMHPNAHIPGFHRDGEALLNEYSRAIAGRLARLGNPPHHAVAKQVVMWLYRQMRPVSFARIIAGLLPPATASAEIDWVQCIGKRLPVISILQGFAFSDADSQYIADRIETLIKIMQPKKTTEQIAAINCISKDIYCLLDKHILSKGWLAAIEDSFDPGCKITREEISGLCISNLTGLLIQSCDAGRGLLGNALLHFVRHPERNMSSVQWQQSVTEILRFDPPVHNTRRIAADNIQVNNIYIAKGRQVLVVLAAANRDPGKFDAPGVYNPLRINNDAQLTFGAGPHNCSARQFSTDMTVAALQYLFESYKTIRLIEKEITYEPLSNLRLIRQLHMVLS